MTADANRQHRELKKHFMCEYAAARFYCNKSLASLTHDKRVFFILTVEIYQELIL